MAVFFTDLDNTLIYSYNHVLPSDKICVESYKGREISFMTKESYELLQILNTKLKIIPTTTRTLEQYKRIKLPIHTQHSLVCNGGILIKDNQIDVDWYANSLSLIKESIYALKKSIELLNRESRRYFEIRFINELFVFTKCHEPNVVVDYLLGVLKTEPVNVFNNGDKIYIVPFNLSKGNCIKRYNELFQQDYKIGAGDSEFDISLLESVNLALCPYDFHKKYDCNNPNFLEMNKETFFSDSLLDYIRNIEIKY